MKFEDGTPATLVDFWDAVSSLFCAPHTSGDLEFRSKNPKTKSIGNLKTSTQVDQNSGNGGVLKSTFTIIIKWLIRHADEV